MIYKLLIMVLLSTSLYASTINLAVAANVSYVIGELIDEFYKKNPNIKVRVTLGSSGKLTAQIINGAPYDIFMSANMKYPNTLYSKKLAITKPIIYAKGSLALLTVKEYKFDNQLTFLKSDSVSKIAIANPKTAPYGKATVEALRNLNLYEDIRHKFVFGESISQSVTYTVSVADVGFIAKSSLYSPKMKMYKKGKNWIDIDTKLYRPIDQGIVMLKNIKNKTDAKKLYQFLLSPKAQDIYAKYGYILP